MPHPWDEDVRGTQVPVLINSDVATIRCVAGPGSGKTFGLVRRVERILHPDGLGVDGHDVLVVAFNRVIAKQLRDDIRVRLKTFDCKHEPDMSVYVPAGTTPLTANRQEASPWRPS